MTLATGEVRDVQWLLVLVHSIVELRDILDKCKIVQVRRTIDTKLPFEVVSTGVDKLVGALPLTVPDLADDDGVFLSAGCIDHKFTLKFTSEHCWRENCVLRVICILVQI